MKIGFIGFGHMAGAMAKGFLKSGHVSPGEIYACAQDFEKLKKRISKPEEDGSPSLLDNINPKESSYDIAKESDIIILAVKPNQVADVLSPIRDELKNKVLISVAFSWDFDKLNELIPETKHISIIPNTPCEVLTGMTLIEDKHNLSPDELLMVERLLGSFGEIEYFSSDKIWLAGELTSCGPAFAAMFIEALGDAGNKYGIEKESAYRIVSQMVAGTGVLQMETKKLPGTMVDEVATPGGVTIKGVTALRDANFHDIVAKAIDAIEKN